MYICGCKRMLMPQDWINIHTHRPGEGVNIVDPCLGNVIMPGRGRFTFLWEFIPCISTIGWRKGCKR